MSGPETIFIPPSTTTEPTSVAVAEPVAVVDAPEPVFGPEPAPTSVAPTPDINKELETVPIPPSTLLADQARLYGKVIDTAHTTRLNHEGNPLPTDSTQNAQCVLSILHNLKPGDVLQNFRITDGGYKLRSDGTGGYVIAVADTGSDILTIKSITNTPITADGTCECVTEAGTKITVSLDVLRSAQALDTHLLASVSTEQKALVVSETAHHTDIGDKPVMSREDLLTLTREAGFVPTDALASFIDSQWKVFDGDTLTDPQTQINAVRASLLLSLNTSAIVQPSQMETVTNVIILPQLDQEIAKLTNILKASNQSINAEQKSSLKAQLQTLNLISLKANAETISKTLTSYLDGTRPVAEVTAFTDYLQNPSTEKLTVLLNTIPSSTTSENQARISKMLTLGAGGGLGFLALVALLGMFSKEKG
ncbi:MAG: hypothetical protein WCO06_05825 [Candidatus Roizmanbacteria bacterium]